MGLAVCSLVLPGFLSYQQDVTVLNSVLRRTTPAIDRMLSVMDVPPLVLLVASTCYRRRLLQQERALSQGGGTRLA